LILAQEAPGACALAIFGHVARRRRVFACPIRGNDVVVGVVQIVVNVDVVIAVDAVVVIVTNVGIAVDVVVSVVAGDVVGDVVGNIVVIAEVVVTAVVVAAVAVVAVIIVVAVIVVVQSLVCGGHMKILVRKRRGGPITAHTVTTAIRRDIKMRARAITGDRTCKHMESG